MTAFHNLFIKILGALFFICASAVATADINATYYDQNGQQNQFFTGTEIVTVDPNINFNWGSGNAPQPGMATDDYSVRWEGELEVPADGNYTFRVRGDDGIQIWVGGVQLIEDWSNHGPRNRDSSAVAMLAGQRYAILVEFYERGGGAVAQVSWSGPTTGGWEIIPANYLFTDSNPPEVLSAGYGCSADSISIVFDKNLDQATAENINHYSLDDNSVSIFSATLEAGSREVTLQTSELTEDDYVVTINNVKDSIGGVIAVDTTVTASFLISGLSATYFDQDNVSGAYFTGNQVERLDATVDFDWGSGSPVTGIGTDRFSVRWEGFVIATDSDDFEFRTRSDDGVRLWIDDVLVIDNWTNHGPRYDYSGNITLVAGQQYAVKMEYFENTGGAVAQLQWRNSNFGWQTIPQSQLLGTCGLPTLQRASFSCSAATIKVVFSEQLDSVTAEDTANYSVDRGVVVNNATLGIDGLTVTLETSSLGPVDYLITVSNVEDSGGIAIEDDSEVSASFQASGLTATYYDQNGSRGAFFTGNTIEQVDALIDNDWARGSPMAGIGTDDFSVRWEGNLVPPTGGNYVFRSRSDDGFRLYLDEVLIIDHWSDHGASYRSSVTQTLVAGQSYRIVVEYYEKSGDAVAQLEWSGPGIAMDIIAAEYFVSGCDTPNGKWQFEEGFWNGSSSEVLDTSGGGHNGTAVGFSGGANPSTQYSSPAVSGDPGTCRYGVFDGVDDYIEVGSSFEEKQQSFTITAWINPENSDPGSRIFADDESNSRGYAFSLGDPGIGRLRFYSRGVNPISVDTSSSVISTNTWTHVAAVHDVNNKTREIYVNGVAQTVTGGGTINTYTGDWGIDSGPASIAGETSSGELSNRFTGFIDEVRFFDRALGAAEINEVYAETHACDNVPTTDHFDIDHSSNAIFCSPTLITVTAKDAGNTTVQSYAQTITLKALGIDGNNNDDDNDGNWSLDSGDGTLENGVDNDGVATYTYVLSDEGVASFLLDRSGRADTDPLEVKIVVTDGFIDDESEENITFGLSGFTITGQKLITGIDPATLRIDSQVAGVEFSAFIAAYGETEDDPSCDIIEAYTGDKSLDIVMNYINPEDSSKSVIESADDDADVVTVNVTFVKGQAELELNYKDVGLIGFTVEDTTDGISGDTVNNFVVVPHHFSIVPEGAADTYSAENSNDIIIYRKAGENFGITVFAEDADNEVVENYGAESPTENVALTHLLHLPALVDGGVRGDFTGSLSLSAGGTFEGTFQWDEVGIISLVAKVEDSDYLGVGAIKTASALSTLSPVGRFTPHHFVIESSVLFPALTDGDFTYLGQPFQVSYTLRAEAKDNGAEDLTTKNYDPFRVDSDDDNFARLPDTDTSIVYSALDGVTDLSAHVLDSANEVFVWSGGVATLTTIDLTLNRLAAPDGPFTNTEIRLSVLDDDGVALLSSDVQIGDSTEFRYGRVFIPPVYGPEINAGDETAIPFVIQYWGGPDGDGDFEFELNILDSETSYSGWDWIQTSCAEVDGPVTCADVLVNPVSALVQVVVGKSVNDPSITIDRPGVNKTGALSIPIVVDNWFKFDWGGVGVDVDPSTQINFGLYRGHDRIIYWREVP